MVILVLVIHVVGGAAILWLPPEDVRIGALAAGATQAVRDLNETYKAALSGRPAYHGYVIDGAFDFHAVKSRMDYVGVPVLSMDQVRPCDWRKERGGHGWGGRSTSTSSSRPVSELWS